ncbi:MAG: hypothetical protein ACLQUY_14070 [Ktedonobacterales bacterium]
MNHRETHSRLLVMARRAWLVAAVFLLANFVFSVPAYYQSVFVPCTSPAGLCKSGQLNLANFHALASSHLSVQSYAIIVTGVNAAVSSLFWVAGILIFWRKGRGWLGLFVSFLLIVFGSAGVDAAFLATFATFGQPPRFIMVPGVIFLLLVNIFQWPALGAFLVTFPTGRFTPRWTWVIVLLWLAQDGLFFLGISNGPALLFAAEQIVVWGSTMGIQVYRYLHIYDAVERQQTKWFVYTLVIAVGLQVVLAALPGIVPALGAPDSWYQLFNAGIVPAIVFVPIPLGIGIAILRYRLWDIDQVINRTLVYGLLTATLASIYVGLIVGLQFAVDKVSAQAEQSPVILVGSTLVIAALFQPLRHRLQQTIDQRFYRRKYDAESILASFSASLRNEVDLTELSQQLVAVVEQTMHPEHISLWLHPPASSHSPSPQAHDISV